MIVSHRRSGSRLSRAVVAALLVFGLSTSAARAEPSAADKETARSLMRQGDAAFEKRSYADAREAYAAAHALMRVPTTGIALAHTQEKLGLLVEARDTALEVTRHAARPDDPPPYAQARAAATKLAEALTARIPSLLVRWSPAAVSDVEVRVDGALVPATAASSPRKLNPGAHEVEVRAPGHLSVVRDVDVAEGRQVAVDVQLVSDGSKPGDSIELPPSDSPSTVPPLAFVAFGVGAVGIGVGAVTGILSLNETAELEDGICGPDGACPSSAADQLDRAETLATVSTVSFVVGAVGITAGVLLVLLRPKTSAAPATGGGASFVQPTANGLRLRF